MGVHHRRGALRHRGLRGHAIGGYRAVRRARPAALDLDGRTLVALAAGGLIACSCLADRAWRGLIANPIAIFFGLVSYNVYPWHALVMIWMWKHDFPRAATPNPHDDPLWKLPYIAIGWTVTLAIATAITTS